MGKGFYEVWARGSKGWYVLTTACGRLIAIEIEKAAQAKATNTKIVKRTEGTL